MSPVHAFSPCGCQKEKPFRKDTSLGQLDQIINPYYIADLAEAGSLASRLRNCWAAFG
jgi:hypothetical protein